jgi:hypothetical protein
MVTGTFVFTIASHLFPTLNINCSVRFGHGHSNVGVPDQRGLGTVCSLGLSATSQQYFSLTTNQPSATSQQYFSLRTNQHQSSATSQTNMLI